MRWVQLAHYFCYYCVFIFSALQQHCPDISEPTEARICGWVFASKNIVIIRQSTVSVYVSYLVVELLLQIYANSALTSVSLPMLASVGKHLQVSTLL